MIELRIGSEASPPLDSWLEWATLLSNTLMGLAWPTIVFLLFWIFRKEIRERLLKLRKFTGPGGVEADFSDELDKAKEDAQGIGPGVPETPITPDDPFLELAENFPEAAVMVAFKALDLAVEELREAFPNQSTAVLIRRMYEMGFLSKDVIKLFDRLHFMRNTAAHSTRSVITPGEALEFRELCEKVAKQLGPAVQKLKQRMSEEERRRAQN